MENLKDSVVLITGGGTGIGKAIASAFIAKGAKVVVTGRRQSVLEETAKELGAQASAIAGDISKNGEPARIVEETVRKHGQLDILVNNAGTSKVGPLSEVTDEDFENIYRTNVMGPLALVRAASNHIVSSKGSVINISSTLSHGAMPGTATYASSKAALNHMTRTLAAEFGPSGVRVNAVAPGFTISDLATFESLDKQMVEQMIAQTPMGRPGQPDEIASAVLLLASNDAGWVTGQVVQAGGGFML